jgi:guanine nucleotide-binding protein G(i) subunit alpha
MLALYLSELGGCNYDRAVAYMKKQFVKLNHNPNRKEIYCHTTCATDTGNIKYVFSVVKDIVIKRILMKSGLVM